MTAMSVSLKEAHEALGFYEVEARLVKLWLEAGEILLVDVRETVEYEQEHIAGSVLCPLSVFNPDLFHQTDTIEFKPDYESRRINVTMLFGFLGY